MTDSCAVCGAEYLAKSGRQLYCSRACNVEAMHERRRALALDVCVELECDCCHETFTQSRPNQYWCSITCRVRAAGRARQGLPSDYEPTSGRWARDAVAPTE